ncbi:hypothetical protein CPLU01_00706 [Colletotrichum plurivorum]|uniref:Uncharacterized protein n=1 Tax=Colletotrichum plurivorum TaxID=2175906 RepID=A0A8H6NRE0_9PEZI|nr:hypothetical protein CPLU01_00706 [Colletotrichum plurivorum]
MTSRDSMTVWLPKELYSSVEPFADQRYIWCPMPFDESLPVEQTSFIKMGGEEEEEVYGGTHQLGLRGGAAGFDGSTETLVDAAASDVEVLDGPTDMSSSETESEKEFASRTISRNLNRGKRKLRKNQSLRHEDPKPEERKSRSFGLHLGLNLDIEVTLKARIHGDLELSVL